MRVFCIVALALLAAGCAARPDGSLVVGPQAVSNYCTIAQPVKVSRADTRATKEQADREYRKYVAACGQPPA